MASFWKMIQFISDKCKIIGAACLAGMALLTCVDVVGRFFKHPVFGSVELVMFMGVLAVAMSLPFTHTEKGHIGVELFVRKLSSRTRASIDFCTSVLSLILYALVTWRMFDYGLKMKESGEVSMNLQLPEYVIILVTAVCFVIFSVMIFKSVLDNLAKMRGK